MPHDDFGIVGGLKAFMSGEFVGSHRFRLCLAFLASALTGIRTEESSPTSVGFNLPGTDIPLVAISLVFFVNKELTFPGKRVETSVFESDQ